jgi:hypothetical protein
MFGASSRSEQLLRSEITFLEPGAEAYSFTFGLQAASSPGKAPKRCWAR